MWGLILACGEPAAMRADPPVVDTAAALSAPPPALDASDVEAEVVDILAAGLPDASSLLDHWRHLFDGASMPCPGITGPFSIVAPFSGCLAADGREWAGYAVYSEGDPIDVELGADATVTGTDGLTFLAAGQVSLQVQEGGQFSSMVVGTWGGADADDWTDPQPSVSLWAEGTSASATLFGGVSLGTHALYIDDARWDGTCTDGEVRVRDPGGWWYAITLTCGCGPLSYEGEELGEVCLDLGIAAMVERTEAAL